MSPIMSDGYDEYDDDEGRHSFDIGLFVEKNRSVDCLFHRVKVTNI